MLPCNTRSCQLAYTTPGDEDMYVTASQLSRKAVLLSNSLGCLKCRVSGVQGSPQCAAHVVAFEACTVVTGNVSWSCYSVYYEPKDEKLQKYYLAAGRVSSISSSNTRADKPICCLCSLKVMLRRKCDK